MLRKLVAATALSAALLVPTAGVAFAHECIIASRSATGDANAIHSSRWGVLTLHDVFAFILPEELGAPALTDAQLAWALTTAESAPYNVPPQWVTRTDKTIGEGSNNPNLADGKGLDHLVDVYGQTVAQIYFQALQQ